MSGYGSCRRSAANFFVALSRYSSACAVSRGTAVFPLRQGRGFVQSAGRRADDGSFNSSAALENALRGGRPAVTPTTSAAEAGENRSAPYANAMDMLSNSLQLGAMSNAMNKPRIDTSSLDGDGPVAGPDPTWDDAEEPFHFHVYSHKHNTHVTVTKPNRDSILSVSCGNLGFKKAKRKQYDSAYQLGAYAIDRLHQGDWHHRINRLEVVLRGFGPGRDAITKVLLSNEGRLWRPKVVRVSDATRLKFGGTRSKGPRRL